MQPQQQDPFAPKYGVPQQQQYQQPVPSYPVGKPKGSKSLLIPFVLVIVLFLGALGFGVWAFAGMQDYKSHSDEKVTAAVTVAQQQTSTSKEKEFTEREKSPLKEYKGPAAFGTVTIQYPKTWSAFVTEAKDNGTTPIDGYFHPGFVPGITSGTDFALRVKVVSKQYADELKQFDSKVKSGKVKVSPYVLTKVPGTPGSMVEGEINTGQQDTMVLFQLRDKTIEISTESAQFRSDFDKIILANLTFIP